MCAELLTVSEKQIILSCYEYFLYKQSAS